MDNGTWMWIVSRVIFFIDVFEFGCMLGMVDDQIHLYNETWMWILSRIMVLDWIFIMFTVYEAQILVLLYCFLCKLTWIFMPLVHCSLAISFCKYGEEREVLFADGVWITCGVMVWKWGFTPLLTPFWIYFLKC